MKKALVLSGGGVFGAYQVGVLQHLIEDEKNDYDVFLGSSVGALNATYLSQFKHGDSQKSIIGLRNLWLNEIRDSSSIYRNWLIPYLPALWKGSLYDSSPLRSLVKKHVKQQLLASSGKKLIIGATNVTNDSYDVVDQNDEKILDWVLASSAYPAILTPIKINGSLYVDAGVQNNLPLSLAIKENIQEIDVVLSTNPALPRSTYVSYNALSIAKRSLTIFNDEAMLNELKIVGLKNDIASLGGKYKNIKFRVFMPKFNRDINVLSFDHSVILDLIKSGYADACSV
jgi:predicted acylesterase/phospholipase RssA